MNFTLHASVTYAKKISRQAKIPFGASWRDMKMLFQSREERKTLVGRLKARLFASPCTATCSRLGSGGTVISILSDVIQLASRLVAVTFRTVWTFSVKYTYSTLLHAAVSSAAHWLTFAWESLTRPYLSGFFSGKPTSSCWHFHSEPRWQRVPEQRAHCVAQIVTFFFTTSAWWSISCECHPEVSEEM